MEPRNGRFRIALFALAGIASLAFATLAGAGEIQRVSLIGPRSTFFEVAAGSAVSLAQERLSSSRCRQIFSDFRDSSGRTLQSKLDFQGYDGPGFLDILRFANGERFGRCQQSRTLAETAPNSHVILLCGERFSQAQRQDPEYAAALVIHELLHSLGLGENPPSSNDITARVLERCGR